MKKYLTILQLAFVISACNFEESYKPEDIDKKEEQDNYELKDPQIIGHYKLTDSSNDVDIVSLDLLSDSSFIAWRKVPGKEPLRRMTGDWKKRASVIKLIVEGKTKGKLSLDQLQGEEAIYETQNQPAKDVAEPFIGMGKYFYMADAATFILCHTNDIYSVYPNEISAEAERKFTEIDDQFKESFYLEAVLSIESKENMEGNTMKQVVLHEILRVDVSPEGCE